MGDDCRKADSHSCLGRVGRAEGVGPRDCQSSSFLVFSEGMVSRTGASLSS
jgi:hypothetical protein